MSQRLPSPDEILAGLTIPPFTVTSGMLARLLESAKIELYREPLSINGHAILEARRTGDMTRVLVAVRIVPYEWAKPTSSEWKLVWERWSSVVGLFRDLGAQPVRLGDKWVGYVVETEFYDIRRVAWALGAARQIAGLKPYVFGADVKTGYDLFSFNRIASELISNIIVLNILFISSGLGLENDPYERWKLIQLLVENDLYMTLDEPCWVLDEDTCYNEYKNSNGYNTTIRNLHERLINIFGEDDGPWRKISFETLRKTIRMLDELGAVERCPVRVRGKDGIIRRKEALFFDLRHELVLSLVMDSLRGGDRTTPSEEVCALLPYVMGVSRESWTNYPGKLKECQRVCSAPASLCRIARKLEERGWPSKPYRPGPCFGKRKVILIESSE